MAIQTVIFDIGNVLVEWDPARPFDRLLGAARRKELFEKVGFDSMNDRSDLGVEQMSDGVAALAGEHPDDADDIFIWHEYWLEMFSPDLPHSAKMLRALRRKGVPVHALSNFGDHTFDLAEGKYPVLKEFDQRFISARINLMKPDPAIYAHVEQAIGGDPSTYLFIDDRADNIDACLARGWQGHLFKDEAGLAARLVAESLLSEKEASA